MFQLRIWMIGLLFCFPLNLSNCRSSVTPAEDPAKDLTRKGETVQETPKITIQEGETAVFRGKKEYRFSNLRGVIYSHLAGSKNESICTVTVETEGAKKDMGFSRMYPGELEYQKFEDLEIALEGVDPYHQPSSAWFLVKEKK